VKRSHEPLQLIEESLQVETCMDGQEGLQVAARRTRLHPRPVRVAPLIVIEGDGDVDHSLEKAAFRIGRAQPGPFQKFVALEVVPGVEEFNGPF
jgi:hypothetical protein